MRHFLPSDRANPRPSQRNHRSLIMSGLPLIEQLKGRMHWLQSRQKVLAENVSNADTPKFKPRDLRQFSPGGQSGLTPAQTSPAHLSGFGGSSSQASRNAARFETVPSGNS